MADRHIKSTDGLPLARGLVLPLDVATQKLAFIGRSGSGKTYGASKLVELMLLAGIQVIVLDGVGVWYGLRLGKAGFDLPIFGGLHGDVPLEPTGGELIADLVVDRGISVVLDVSMMRKGPRKQFATLFAEQFFQRKKARRSPVHIVIEESQMFVPQRPQQTERRGGISDGRMKGAFEDLTKIGRNFGIGHTLITQRPQAVDKDVLNQIEVLFAFQTNGVHEKKAICDWVTDKGLEVNLVEELPGLEIGQPWVWSPQWLRITKHIRINRKVTADTSSTPEHYDEVTEPVPLASADMKQLQQDMAATIERAKAEDPKALRVEVAKLKRELQQREQRQPEPVVEHVEVPVLSDAHVAQMLEASTALADAGDVALRIGKELLASLEKVRNNRAAPRKPTPRQPVAPPARPAKHVATGQGNGSTNLPKCERSVLSVLAQHPEGCSISKIALLAGYRVSGGFRNALGNLRNLGLIDGANTGTMVITDTGMGAGEFQALPAGAELISYWTSHTSFGRCEREILHYLVGTYPATANIDDLAAATGYRVSGGFRNSLGKLRTAGLLVGRNTGDMTVADDLAEHVS
ncbi:hypothetical protein LCGC14_1372550 [marine sediment metagenome]|uniref:Helicase HerA central domain-containing protein n=1 Tax=marine sediment metagenome TaxID=412755 RepID=A0A0F9N6Y3_9ZZZZ